MVGARVRRQQVAYADGRGLSSRRACALLSVARSTLGYVSRLIARDAPVAAADADVGRRSIRATAIARFGSSSSAQGHAMSADRMYRLWRQAGLQVPKKRPRRRVATSRPAAAAADGRESRVGVRLRVRHLRRWPDAEVPDGHRRVHARVPRDRRRRRHSVRPRDRGAGAARERPRRAALPALGQWPGVRRARDPAVAADGADRDGASSIRASRGRMAPTNRSTASSATSTSRCSGFAIAPTRRSASSSGGGTTTRCGRIRVSGYLTPAGVQSETSGSHD